MIKVIGFIFIVVLVPSNVWAHSGGTNADGCHTNRKTGDTHCHNKKLKSQKNDTPSEIGNETFSSAEKPPGSQNKNRIFQWVDENGGVHYSKEVKDLPKNSKVPANSE
jgi:uncharacterized protein DUF4124